MSSEDHQVIYWIHKQREAGIAFLVLCCIFVALRFAVRRIKREAAWGWDDILIIPSLLSIITLSVLTIVTANEDLTLSNPYATEAALLSAYISTEKASYGSSVIYPLACAFPKLSVAALYLRLFPPSGPSRIMRLGRRASWWIIVFLVANCIAFFIPSTAACLPPSAYWTYPAQLQKCLNLTALGTWISFPHILSDIVMLLIPLPLVWRLQVSLRKKLGLTVIFLAGGLGLIGCCARFGIYIYTTYVSKTFAQQFRSILGVMTLLEPSMYLIAACLPPILTFMSHAGMGLVSLAWSSIRRSKRSLGSESEPASDRDIEARALRSEK